MDLEFVVFGRQDGELPRGIEAAIVEPSVRQRLPWAATIHLPFQMMDNGLPVQGEFPRVSKIEDQLIDLLELQGMIHVGHVTSNGTMRAIFYGPTRGPGSLTVRVGLLKRHEVMLEWRHDPGWSLYELELQPTAREHMESKYRQLLMTLGQHGDNHSIARTVDFAANFPTAGQRSAFIDEALSHGYVLSPQSTWEPDADSFWCELNKTTAIEPPIIFEECALLNRLASSHGGEFDGWATTVEN